MGHVLLLTEQAAYERAKRLSALLASALPDREIITIPASGADRLDQLERLSAVSLLVADTATPLTDRPGPHAGRLHAQRRRPAAAG